MRKAILTNSTDMWEKTASATEPMSDGYSTVICLDIVNDVKEVTDKHQING